MGRAGLCENRRPSASPARLKLFKAIKARDNLQVCTDQIPNSWCIPMPITGDKRRHYWVWSSGPNFGKTTWLKWLSDRFRCSWYNTSEGFQSDIREDTQFLLFDEYSGGKVLKSTQLNQMCDGTYIYPSREGQELLFKNPSSLSLATETCRNSILTPGHSYRLDSMSFSLAKTISSREMTP